MMDNQFSIPMDGKREEPARRQRSQEEERSRRDTSGPRKRKGAGETPAVPEGEERNGRTSAAFCVGGAGSGVGKTTVTLAILAAFKKRGLKVAPFKCGPDYIDPEFHRAASGRISRNLDTWMMGESAVLDTFRRNSTDADVSVVEGVMGLFDGAEIGRIAGSTADVAKLAAIPVLLVVNARGIAETIAPIVRGFTDYADGVEIVGVIANKVGSEKHAEMLAEALKLADLPPLLGFLPRDSALEIPERHLGLVSATEKVGGGKGDWEKRRKGEAEKGRSGEFSILNEKEGKREWGGGGERRTSNIEHSTSTGERERRAFEDNPEFYEVLANLAEKYFKLDEIVSLTSRPIEDRDDLVAVESGVGTATPKSERRVRVGVAMDEAFHFYYEDNFDLMRAQGMEIVEFSPLRDARLPEDLDWLYIGGGFPESFAAILAENRSMMNSIAEFADSGRFIFAECGGLMYLSDGITDFNGDRLEMCGIIKGWTTMESKLRRLGYREVRMTTSSPLGSVGTVFRGHEFHWSSINESDNAECFCEIRGSKGGDWSPAGFRVGNTFASYIHAHFASNPKIMSNILGYICLTLSP